MSDTISMDRLFVVGGKIVELVGTPDDYISHYGKAHDENPPGPGSGRYPWGSGNRKHQHEWDLKSRIEKYEASGMSDSTIAKELGLYQLDFKGNPKLDANGNPLGSSKRLKAVRQIATNAVKMDEGEEVAWYLGTTNPQTGKAYTYTEIARILYNDPVKESKVRSIWKTYQTGNQNKVTQVVEALKERVAQSKYIDVGSGTELQFDDPNGLHGISSERLDTALEMLQIEGYTVAKVDLQQVTGKNKTTFKVLAAPGTTQGDIYKHMLEIEEINGVGGIHNKAIIDGVKPPVAIDLSRVAIKYAEQGGTEQDGLIQIRAVKDANGNLVAAAPDLSLGNARYGQIRIAVNGGKECITEDNPTGLKYIKGMAVYSEDIPDGFDILVNSNKSQAKGPQKALKDLGDINERDPFGSAVVQTQYIDPTTGKRMQSAINFVGSKPDDMHVEGSWSNWNKNLASQFLAKQPLGLIQQQLNIKMQTSESELKDIMALNNPAVKKKLLQDFADQCDASAADLKAAPIPGQSVKVLLPCKTLKDSECYCPSMDNGSTVAIVRFPHEGPWEIKVAKVNNGNEEGKKMFGNGQDAIGINHNSASILSGADFDGDTGVVIPMTKRNSKGELVKVNDISTWEQLGRDVQKQMEGFDPTEKYSTDNPRFSKMVDKHGHPTYHVETEEEKQMNMGIVANLMTDMVQKGCQDPVELGNVTKFNQVVIDGHKHELNVDQAKQDLHIDEYHLKYQGKVQGGASTILSRAKSPVEINERRPFSGYINPETGNRVRNGVDIKTGVKVDNAVKVTNGINTLTGEKVWEDTGKQERVNEKVRVPAPQGYVWKDPNTGKEHSNYKYMRDPNGKEVYQTKTGSIYKDEDGYYQYDKGKLREDGTPNYVWIKGALKDKKTTIKKMDYYSDARELMSKDHPSEVEKVYADYANHQKALANRARKEIFNAGTIKKNKEAREKYAPEVESLSKKLYLAQTNSYMERQAQLCATSMMNAWYQDHRNASKDKVKKQKTQAMNAARQALGAGGKQIKFTEKEWEAVNAGAISESMLNQILRKADKENYTRLATPKAKRISDSTIDRIKELYSGKNGKQYSIPEIAAYTGYSLATINSAINNKQYTDLDDMD